MTKTFPILPDLTCPELAGYKLPPCSRGQEDGVEAMAELEYREYPSDPKGSGFQNNRDINCHRKRRAFIKGYTKAREKFEFSESDLMDAILWAMDKARRGDIYNQDIYNFIQSLRTPRTPIAIEVEMVEQFEMVSGIHFVVPATNPDGTVKGRWVYE